MNMEKGIPQINIVTPEGLEPTFFNVAMVSDNFSEIFVDYIMAQPRTPAAKIVARIICTPPTAKMLAEALNDHIVKYEEKNGEIKMPPDGSGLAESLFGQEPVADES
jgi:hypothetical protein